MDSQREILRRSRTLRNVDGYQNIYINKDLTVDEQKKQRLLRAELTRRRNEGEDVSIRNGRVFRNDTDGIRRENFRQ